MEGRAGESIEEQRVEMPVKTEVEPAGTPAAYVDIEIDLHLFKHEPRTVHSVKRESTLLVKEEIVDDSSEDGNDQQCVQSAATPASAVGLNEAHSRSLGDLLHVKQEPADMDIEPSVLQHTDVHHTINKNTSAVTEQRTIVHHSNEACSRVEAIVHKLRSSHTSRKAKMNKQNSCSMLQNSQRTVYQLESICSVHLTRLEIFQCELCDAVYTDNRRRLLHLRNVHGSEQQTSLLLKCHKTDKQHHAAAIKTISCKYCGQMMTKGDYGEIHLKSCPGQQKDLQQQISVMTNSVVAGPSPQNRNETAKTKQKPDVCNKEYSLKTTKFGQNAYLTKQIKVNVGGEKPYQCNTCDARFARNCYLKRHLITHSDDKPYRCDTCDAKFARKGYLTEHMRVHTGVKPFRCDTCDARFARNSSLVKHLRVHTGEKPYQCNTCNASFARNTSFSKHMRIHTGEKPYLCVTCDARFAQYSNLFLHMRVHTGEKPYQCETCDRKFSRNSSLIKHMSIHSGEKPHLCNTCDARFAHNNALIEHIRVHTGRNPIHVRHVMQDLHNTVIYYST